MDVVIEIDPSALKFMKHRQFTAICGMLERYGMQRFIVVVD